MTEIETNLGEVDTRDRDHEIYETIERSPAKLSLKLAVLAASIATVMTVFGGGIGMLVALPALVLFVISIYRGAREKVILGASLLFVANVIAASSTFSPIFALLGAVASVLAWDVGENAINIGHELGREADTRNAELTHAASSTAVGAIGAVLVYGIYIFGSGGRPVASLIFLVIAVIPLVLVLRS